VKNDNHYNGPRPQKSKENVFTVTQDATLLTFLLDHLPGKGRRALKAVLRDRQVFVDDIPITQFDHLLTPGRQVKVCWSREKPSAPVKLKIVFEDESLIVIEKPSGLLTIATDKEKRKTVYSLLSEHVKRENPANKIFIVHRLDRETSGLLLFAKTSKVKQQIQESWEQLISQRTYVGVVEGAVAKEEGTITSWLAETTAFRVYSVANPQAGRKAVTQYRKIGGNSDYSLLQINLDTGRKHQIRVHMQDMGHPIVGDKKYGARTNPIHRIALHAQVLAFTHPVTGQERRFETPVPEQFRKLAQQGKKDERKR
jgi:23S rRNA pseudouridine1911/1915/1917 synthase